MQPSSTNTTKQQCPPQKRYQNKKVCGNGTFGVVYMAQDLMNQHEKVAIKNVHQNKKYKNRQLEILQQIHHPNIIKLLNYYPDEKKENPEPSNTNKDKDKETFLNLVMQYLPYTLSTTIKDHIYSKTFLSNQSILKYSYGLLNALAYLQVTVLIHRIFLE